MEHKFSPSLADEKFCLHCKRNFRDHSKLAICEACGAIGPCDLIGTILECTKCYKADMDSVKDYQAPELQDARLAAHNEKLGLDSLIEQSVKIDQSIQLVTDIFNAQTVATDTLCKAIDADESITNKPYAKNKLTYDRVRTFQSALFDAKQKVVELENAVRANQVYLNTIINQLRETERAEFKFKDINYPVSAPKKPKKSKAADKAGKTTKSTSVNMADVIKWAAILNIPAAQQIIHMRMLSKQMNAEAATRSYALEHNITLKI
jgi:hypothetical protein